MSNGFYRELALSICREIKDYREEGYSLWGLGNAYQALKQPQKAIEYYQQALEVLKRINDFRGISLNLNSLGELFNSLDQPREALECYNEILEIGQGMNDSQVDLSLRDKIDSVQRKIEDS